MKKNKINKHKIVLVVLEGESDLAILENQLVDLFEEKFGEKYKLVFLVPRSKDNNDSNDFLIRANKDNYIGQIRLEVTSQKKTGNMEMAFSEDSLYMIIQISDTDASFLKEDRMIEYSKPEHNNEGAFYYNTIDEVIEYGEKVGKYGIINAKKRRDQIIKRNYEKQIMMRYIQNLGTVKYGRNSDVKYMAFYFSCNMDHCMYDIPNFPEGDQCKIYSFYKPVRAKQRSEEYESHMRNFCDDICEVGFKALDIEKTFKELNKDSWKYLGKDTNSIKRGTNLNLLFKALETEFD